MGANILHQIHICFLLFPLSCLLLNFFCAVPPHLTWKTYLSGCSSNQIGVYSRWIAVIAGTRVRRTDVTVARLTASIDFSVKMFRSVAHQWKTKWNDEHYPTNSTTYQGKSQKKRYKKKTYTFKSHPHTLPCLCSHFAGFLSQTEQGSEALFMTTRVQDIIHFKRDEWREFGEIGSCLI